MKYYLSLGSNIDPKLNLDKAITALKILFSEVECSSIHQTKAEGFDGEDFLNLVFCGTCSLPFEVLNKKLKDIEDETGRDRKAPKFSARTLDIDIVLQISEDEEIVYESDEIIKYTFVSDPLKELL